MTPAPVEVPGADPAAVGAITEAAQQLASLSSYPFEVGVAGGRYVDLNRDEYEDFTTRGILTRDPKLSVDAEDTASQPAIFGQPGSSVKSRLLIVDDAWLPSGPSGTPVPVGRRSLVVAFLPDEVVVRLILPFVGAYERVGEELRNGITAIHYRATPAGRRAFAATMLLEGLWSADLWIAKRGGYLVAAEMSCDPPSGSPEWIRPFHMHLDIRDANDPGISITLPR